MIDNIYQVKLDDVFEGPMDLLVYLIRKNEVDIYDIPIAMITDQYIQYVEWMKSLNIDFAGDFLVMASTLANIKSKMLLPIHYDEENAEDPRLELTRPLLEYLQMKSAAEQLTARDMLGEKIFVRNISKKDYLINYETDSMQIGLFELVDAFQKILGNLSAADYLDINIDTMSVKDKISQLADILEKRNSIAFDELFAEGVNLNEIIATFLAILEMARHNIIRIIQHSQNGVIRLFYQ